MRLGAALLATGARNRERAWSMKTHWATLLLVTTGCMVEVDEEAMLLEEALTNGVSFGGSNPGAPVPYMARLTRNGTANCSATFVSSGGTASGGTSNVSTNWAITSEECVPAIADQYAIERIGMGGTVNVTDV